MEILGDFNETRRKRRKTSSLSQQQQQQQQQSENNETESKNCISEKEYLCSTFPKVTWESILGFNEQKKEYNYLFPPFFLPFFFLIKIVTLSNKSDQSVSLIFYYLNVWQYRLNEILSFPKLFPHLFSGKSKLRPLNKILLYGVCYLFNIFLFFRSLSFLFHHYFILLR